MDVSRTVAPGRHLRWDLGILVAAWAFGATDAVAQDAPPPQGPPSSGWTDEPNPPNQPSQPNQQPSAPTSSTRSPEAQGQGDPTPAQGPAVGSHAPQPSVAPQPTEPGSGAHEGPHAHTPPPPTTSIPPAPAYGGYPPYGYAPPPGYAGYPPLPDCALPDERPTTLPYREGRPPPEGYYYEERLRRGPIIAGAIVFGVPYALGLSVAGGDDFSNQTGWLAVPVVGPWITLAARDRCDPLVTYNDTFDTFDSTCDGERTIRTLLVMDALMQTTGAALLLWGLTSKTKQYVRNDVSLQVLPTQVGRSGYGLGAVGSF